MVMKSKTYNWNDGFPKEKYEEPPENCCPECGKPYEDE